MDEVFLCFSSASALERSSFSAPLRSAQTEVPRTSCAVYRSEEKNI